MKIMIRHVSRKVIITLGIVCSLATAGAYGQTFTILHTFRGSPDAGYPVAGVLLDGRGNIYGVTMFDGANQEGAVFRIDSDGEETVLHSFGTSPSDGVFPEGGLVADAEGNVYGTTGGGTHSAGTVFKIDSKGQYSVVYSFKTTAGDAKNPAAGLVQDKAGNLYGTSPSGGAAAAGAIYQIPNKGREKVIYSFTGSPNRPPRTPIWCQRQPVRNDHCWWGRESRNGIRAEPGASGQGPVQLSGRKAWTKSNDGPGSRRYRRSLWHDRRLLPSTLVHHPFPGDDFQA
jgi:uncharacterized repeat protein (TIGR03803 family)